MCTASAKTGDMVVMFIAITEFSMEISCKSDFIKDPEALTLLVN